MLRWCWRSGGGAEGGDASDKRLHEECAVARRGADIADRLTPDRGEPPCLPQRRRGGWAADEGLLGCPCAPRRRRYGTEGDPRLRTALACRIEREPRGDADDGNLHGPAPTGLEKCGGGALRESGETDAGEELAGVQRGLTRSNKEAIEGERTLALRASARHRGVEGEEHGCHISGG